MFGRKECKPGEHVPGQAGDLVRVRKINGRSFESWTECDVCGHTIIHGKKTDNGRIWAWKSATEDDKRLIRECESRTER